jgi:hypothetical protein
VAHSKDDHIDAFHRGVMIERVRLCGLW